MTKSAFKWWLPSMLLIAVTVIAQSCYYDNKAENYGSSACDSANPTYTANIQPIINQNCILLIKIYVAKIFCFKVVRKINYLSFQNFNVFLLRRIGLIVHASKSVLLIVYTYVALIPFNIKFFC